MTIRTNILCCGLIILLITLLAVPASASGKSTTIHPNLQTIQKFFEYYAKGDLNGIRSVMADDVSWHIPGHHPLAGTKQGLKELMAFFKALGAAKFKAEVLFIAADERHVVDVHRGWSNTGKADLDQVWVLFYEFKNRKIWRVRNFAADQHQADLFFNRVYKLKPLQERLVPAGKKENKS